MQLQSKVSIRKYSPGDEQRWNDFVAKAGNASFLFDRRYMDYHSHRFIDHSLMIFVNDNLRALFVANEDGNKIHSHGGLTYGGLVVEHGSRMEEVLRYFFHILKYYSKDFKFIVYKCFPWEFMRYRSQEDLYAMFLLNAELIGRQASSVYQRNAGIPYRRSKKETTSKPATQFSIIKSTDPSTFWSEVLAPNLQERFGTSPVHAAAEMKLLMDLFPSNIHLFQIHDNELLAGAVIFEMDDIVHTQYLSTTENGRKVDALDILIDHLVMNVFKTKSRFSFGTSNGHHGRTLTKGLIAWKEGFGARTSVHDIYLISTDQYHELADYE